MPAPGGCKMNLYRHAAAWAALAALLALPVSSSAQPSGPTVDAPAGRVQGLSEGALNVFKGIPYAQPPVGSLRWKAPVPLPRWAGVKQRHRIRRLNACSPIARTPNIYADNLTADERGLPDAQHLGARERAQRAGVLLDLWRGAGGAAPAASPLYDGAQAGGARHGGRDDQLPRWACWAGWRIRELSAESPLGISGNYGLLDQIAALRWVKEQHRRLRRRSCQRDHRGRIRRRR